MVSQTVQLCGNTPPCVVYQTRDMLGCESFDVVVALCWPVVYVCVVSHCTPRHLSVCAEVEHVNKKLSSSHSSKLDKERERQKMERANRKLRQELEDYKVSPLSSLLT